MISNEKNYQLQSFITFEIYNFYFGSFIIHGHLKNAKKKFKLFVQVIFLTNRH